MPKFYPRITVAQDTGNKPCMVKLSNDKSLPDSVRGKTVTGRANWHGYQGVVDNEAHQEVWRGKMHEGPNLFGTVTVGGVTYSGDTVPGSGQSDAALQAAALSDAKIQASVLAKASTAPAKKSMLQSEACPHCASALIDGSCPGCTDETYQLNLSTVRRINLVQS